MTDHNDIEGRLLTALSKCGNMTIGGFIQQAANIYDPASRAPWMLEDKELVLVCEHHALGLEAARAEQA